MAKMKSGKREAQTAKAPGRTYRTSLPRELEERLQAVWRRLGHLIDWCDKDISWTRMFCSEARPYRQTFYWEAVADIVADYMLEHPEASPEGVLTDCLVATQCHPVPDERRRLTDLRAAWQEILDRSREAIESFIQSDLELAVEEGSYETVAGLYAADYQKLERDRDSCRLVRRWTSVSLS